MNPYQQVQDTMLQRARTIRSSGEELLPIAFLLSPQGIHMMPLDFPNELWPDAIHSAIAQTQAHAIIIQSEAWVVIDDDVPEAVMAKLQGLDLQEFPGRLERITSMMETNDGTLRQLHIDILPNGSLGETEEHIMTGGHTHGRLTGFFPATSNPSHPIDYNC